MSKNIDLPRRTFWLILILAFAAGVALAQGYQRYAASKEAVPPGSWKSIWVGVDSALQVNLSTISLRNSALTTWIREDRSNLASQGLTLTTLTLTTIDCRSRMVAIHEQRVLDANMNVIFSDLVDEGPTEPKTFSSIMSLNLICGLKPTRAAPSDKNDYLSNA